MSNYYNATICENGHTISHNNIVGEKFCEICGAPNISCCPSCGMPIHGKENTSGFVSAKKYIVPKYCYNCGQPYPWTASALEVAAAMIYEDSSLSESEKTKLNDSLPDIVSETPKTRLAGIITKKLLPSAESFTADALKQFIIDFGCELAVKLIMK